MSPMNIAILAAIGGLLVLLLTLRRKRRRADDDHAGAGGAAWASPAEPAAAPAPPPAPPASGAWVVGGGGASGHEGPFAPAAAPARPPAELVTEPGWPLPDADEPGWDEGDEGPEPAGHAVAGDSAAHEDSEAGWFAPTAAAPDPALHDDDEDATGPMPAISPADDAGLAAAWASWTPEQDDPDPVHEPALAAAEQAAALTLEPRSAEPEAGVADDDIAEAIAAFVAEPAPGPGAEGDEPAWASPAWEQPIAAPSAEVPPIHAWDLPDDPAARPAEALVPNAARNTARDEDVFAAFISPAPAPAEADAAPGGEPVAWWDLPEPEPEHDAAAAGATALGGRFAVGGHALFPGHEMVGAVQFRAPRAEAPEGWSVEGAGADPDPGGIRLRVEGARNVAEGGVEVLTEPGFAPCEEGFTLRVRSAEVGPVLVSGTYRID